MAENHTVLIVEDSMVQAHLLKRLLAKEGYLVEIANNGAEGIKLTREKLPDIIVSDVNMPVMDGYEMCKLLKNDMELQDIPIILLTQLSTPRDIIAGINAQADNYITKPYNEEYLLYVIDYLISEHAGETDILKYRLNTEDNRYLYDTDINHILNFLLSTYENALFQKKQPSEGVDENLSADLPKTHNAIKGLNEELKRMTTKLKSSEERFRALVTTAPDIICNLDTDGNFIFINDAISKLGYRPSELIGRHFSEIVYRQDMETIDRKNIVELYRHGELLDGGQSRLFDEKRTGARKTEHLEIRLIPKGLQNSSQGLMEDNLITVEVSSSGIYESHDSISRHEIKNSIIDSEKNFVGTVAIMRDITARKKAERMFTEQRELLLQQSKLAAMGEMLAMIAHQWRQPLSSISTTAADIQMSILMDELNKEELQRSLSKINEKAQFLSNTINDFRNFFNTKKNKEKVDICMIVERTLSIIGKSLENSNIKIIKEIGEGCEITTYANELTQVLLNIVMNAQDAFIETKTIHPQITISANTIEDGIRLSIADNGHGIPLDIMDKIFDPYFSTKQNKAGTGLGLYMSKTIIEKHCQGRIYVNSSENGATFVIELPENI